MPRLTIIGDVNVEVIGRLEIPFQAIDANQLIYSGLDMRVGGTTWKFATAARDLFDPICVVGSVGDDYLGTWAEQSLNNVGIATRLRRDPSLPTGLAVSMWDGTEHGGIRLLVIRSENANHALDVRHIQNNADCLANSEFVMTDGYCLLKDPRRSATLHAMRRAARAGAQVVVDIVPHDCYQTIGLTELSEWLEYATVAIVEVITIRRLLQLETSGKAADLPLALETMKMLSFK